MKRHRRLNETARRRWPDTWAGKLALDEIKRCKDLGLSGIGELNPARQHFFANDIRFYPLWEQCAKLKMPILFHGGMAAAGCAPKYFPAELVHNVNTLLQDKAMFGSDWPAIGVERWLEEFQQVNIKAEVRQKIMLDNAVKFLGLRRLSG